MIITIDGPAGVGKSSVASHLAQEHGLLLLKSGAFYRALSLHLIEQLGSSPVAQNVSNPERFFASAKGRELWRELWQTIKNVKIYQAGDNIFINGQKVTDLLATRELDLMTPQISKQPDVRHFINNLLRHQGKNHSLVAEGRDMGTVVFPQAQYKFFLDASVAARARRRQRQLGAQSPSLAELERQLQARDEIDRHKKEGALKPAKNCQIIDTSDLTLIMVCRIIAHNLNIAT